LLFSVFLLSFACNPPKQGLSQEELEAKIEAARKTDSLLNWSKGIEDARGLSLVFSGVHAHGIMGTGNLAFDAHQDPEQARLMIRGFATLAENYKENVTKIEEARRQMIRDFQKAQEEENRRIY
jgi:hypothetical protein